MADGRQGEEKASSQPGPKLELRSDALIEGGPGSKGKWSRLKDKQKVLYLGVAIVILLIIGLGVFAALRQPQETDGEENEGRFGNLPSSGERERGPVTHSGLSGVACDHPDRRPIGVMLAADPISRPVSGFASADMVWELPVLVSDVTRLIAVYQCSEPGDIGSVRSARHDYLFLAEGIDAILAHWGGSYHALNRINVGEFDTINALTNPFGAYFRKDHLPAPYNGYTTYERLWNALQQLGYRTTTNFEGYEFKDDIAPGERPPGGTLSIAWPGAYRVHYEYDAATNRYQRFWGGTKQVDGEDEAPVAPSSIVIMRAANSFAEGPGGYNNVDIEGEGALEVYQDGKVITGRWSKDERYKNDPVDFVNEQGEPIVFTRGQVWVMAVEPQIDVTWEVSTATKEAEVGGAG